MSQFDLCGRLDHHYIFLVTKAFGDGSWELFGATNFRRAVRQTDKAFTYPKSSFLEGNPRFGREIQILTLQSFLKFTRYLAFLLTE